MPIVVHNGGYNNVVAISEEDLKNGSCLIEFRGNDNFIEISTPHLWGSPSFVLCEHSSVTVGKGCVLAGLVVYSGPGSTISIGKDSSFTGTTGIMAHEPSSISIGDGCLFAADTSVMSSDMHSIVSRQTGLRINPAASIEIGPRVWLGFRVIVLKGSVIGEGAVIGAGAVVAGKIDAWCAAAGNPARALRSDVTWTHALL